MPARASRPAETVVAPLYALLPVSVSVPEPTLVMDVVPEKMPLNVDDVERAPRTYVVMF